MTSRSSSSKSATRRPILAHAKPLELQRNVKQRRSIAQGAESLQQSDRSPSRPGELRLTDHGSLLPGKTQFFLEEAGQLDVVELFPHNFLKTGPGSRAVMPLDSSDSTTQARAEPRKQHAWFKLSSIHNLRSMHHSQKFARLLGRGSFLSNVFRKTELVH